MVVGPDRAADELIADAVVGADLEDPVFSGTFGAIIDGWQFDGDFVPQCSDDSF